jgi:hypothetical protein
MAIICYEYVGIDTGTDYANMNTRFMVYTTRGVRYTQDIPKRPSTRQALLRALLDEAGCTGESAIKNTADDEVRRMLTLDEEHVIRTGRSLLTVLSRQMNEARG